MTVLNKIRRVTLAVLEMDVKSNPMSALFGGLTYVKAAIQVCMQTHVV